MAEKAGYSVGGSAMTAGSIFAALIDVPKGVDPMNDALFLLCLSIALTGLFVIVVTGLHHFISWWKKRHDHKQPEAVEVPPKVDPLAPVPGRRRGIVNVGKARVARNKFSEQIDDPIVNTGELDAEDNEIG